MKKIENWKSGFENFLRNQKLSENTVRSYLQKASYFNDWLENSGGSLCSVSRTDLLDYKSYIIRRSAATTLNAHIAMIRQLVEYLSREGFLSSAMDIATVIGPVTVQKRLVPKSLSKREQRALRRSAEQLDHPRNSAALELMLCCGLRVAEVANIQLKDISLGPKHGRVSTIGKGEKMREVPINERARIPLRLLIETLPQPTAKEDFLFKGHKGRMTSTGIRNIIKKVARLADLEAVRPHILRHTFAKNCLDSGMDLGEVQRLLGHSKIETTMVYLQPSMEEMADKLEKI